MKTSIPALPSATRWLVPCWAIAVAIVLGAPLANAQFHERKGDKVIPRQEIPTSTAAAAAAGSTTGAARNYAAATTTTTGANGVPLVRDKDSREFRTSDIGIGDLAWTLKLSEQESGMADIVWGRAIHHPNGNYTVSKIDKSTLIQRTFSQPKTTEEHQKTDDERQPVERRVVQLDAGGRPIEVLIYDIRNQLKFRGRLVYDTAGRFMEEQLFSPNEQIVRRRVQRYDALGSPLPLETFMDADTVESDIALVLTGSDSPTGAAAAITSHSGGGTATATAAAPKEKKSLLRRAGSALMFWKD